MVAIAAIIATVLASVVSAAGAIQQGKAAKRQAEYQAAVLRNNEIIAQRRAADARKRGEADAEERSRLTALQRGTARASAAARGVEVGSGSALDIQADVAGIGKLEERIIRNNAEREALGFEAQGSNFAAEAELNLMRGRDAVTASKYAAIGSILGGGSKAASQYYGFKSQGAFN